MKYYSSYPPGTDKNPFFKLLSFELVKHQWVENTFDLRTANLWKYRSEVQVLWFHWPNYIWRNHNIIIKWLKIIRFCFHLFFAKILSYKLVWSAHNVLPHGEENSKLEWLLRRMICQIFDLVIGHSKNTMSMLKEKSLNPANYVLAIHGNYENEYKERNTTITRQYLGVAKTDTLLLLKNDRRSYSEVMNFIEIYRESSCKSIKLLAIGNHTSESTDIIHIPGFIPKRDLASYISLSDFVCLPYSNITTSGLFFLALTFEKPVIAQKIPFFVEHIGSQTAILYANGLDLKNKLEMLHRGEVIIDKGEISHLKNKYSWADSAIIIARAFEKL